MMGFLSSIGGPSYPPLAAGVLLITRLPVAERHGHHVEPLVPNEVTDRCNQRKQPRRSILELVRLSMPAGKAENCYAHEQLHCLALGRLLLLELAEIAGE